VPVPKTPPRPYRVQLRPDRADQPNYERLKTGQIYEAHFSTQRAETMTITVGGKSITAQKKHFFIDGAPDWDNRLKKSYRLIGPIEGHPELEVGKLYPGAERAAF
jgi:hypothetical protein